MIEADDMLRDGFLGYDASFMLDVVVVALVLLVPLLAYSIYVVKVRRRYRRHRNLQLILGGVLLIAVGAFEIDMQVVHGGWENIVNKDPSQPRLTGEALASVRRMLRVHLVFAISTPVLWLVTTVLALRRMPSPPGPCPHSRWHRRLGWASAIDLALTSVTGLAFYYMAFVA